MNTSENLVAEINSNVFFKEFTFSKNNFIDSANQKLEFSDNVVWLDDIFFIFEIKEREKGEIADDSKWFQNKILGKAVKQIKATHTYLKKYPEISIVNEKGHQRNIADACLDEIVSVIIYAPSENFTEEQRFRKFYESSQVGLIHLFHSEDYYWVCNYLLTPAEIKEYLLFREELFQAHPNHLNNLPEQYVLAHFFETLDTSSINPSYISNLDKVKSDVFDFNLSGLIENFNKDIRFFNEQTDNEQTDYYPIIAEIAKLNRVELSEFKKRFVRTMEVCKKQDFDIPYRMYIPRTDCGFVFIPLPKHLSKNWKAPLSNYTLLHKYDQKANRCVGLVMFEIEVAGKTIMDMYWLYAEDAWEFNEEAESLIKDNFPFREAKTKNLGNRYID